MDAVVVDPDDRLMIITKNGITIKMEVGTIREAGRSTQGVKLMNLDAGDAIASAALKAAVDALEERWTPARQRA